MPDGEAVTARVLANVSEAQRLRVIDQHTQHSPPTREVADRPTSLLVHARGQELLKRGVIFVQDAKGGIAGSRDLACRLEHAIEQDALIELLRKRAAHIEQTANPMLFG
jgi:hypothetical protein